MKLSLRRSKRPRIAVDYDGTLLPTYEAIATWSDKTYGTHHTPFKPADWPDHWMEQAWGPNAKDKSRRFDHDLNRDGFDPVTGAQHAMARLNELAEIVVVTSGTVPQRKIKRRWLAAHFPFIKQVVFIDGKGRYPTKSVACQKLNLGFIIEDRYDYASECAKAGIPAIILNRYRWSRGPENELIATVKDWPAAEKLALELLEP